MNKFISTRSKLTLVVATTLIAITATLTILYVGYDLMGVEVRQPEIVIGFVAPLSIASLVTWYLYGLIKKLEYLERELRNRITKEKEEVYLATIHGAQHVLNNLLNGLTMIELEIKKHPTFNKTKSHLFRDLISDSTKLVDELSSVKDINPETIKKSVAPK